MRTVLSRALSQRFFGVVTFSGQAWAKASIAPLRMRRALCSNRANSLRPFCLSEGCKIGQSEEPDDPRLHVRHWKGRGKESPLSRSSGPTKPRSWAMWKPRHAWLHLRKRRRYLSRLRARTYLVWQSRGKGQRRRGEQSRPSLLPRKRAPRRISESLGMVLACGRQGYEAAQNNLGSMYFTGAGVAQDYSKALEWLTKAADQGNDETEWTLGQMHANGLGLAARLSQAIVWYTRAAQHQLAAAQSRPWSHVL